MLNPLLSNTPAFREMLGIGEPRSPHPGALCAPTLPLQGRVGPRVCGGRIPDVLLELLSEEIARTRHKAAAITPPRRAKSADPPPPGEGEGAAGRPPALSSLPPL